jgi:nicotinate-nucleotide--dimethylbenzimidazole phosphoribosyltransferase
VITALTPQAPGDAHLAGAAAAADPWQARLHTAVRDGLARHRPDPTRPLAVLAAVGGLEHAAITGFILGAAAHRVPVVTDGVVAGSAALVATALAPAAAGAIFSGDGARALLDGARSVHPGPAVPR